MIRKVLILASGGSGKSALATDLGRLLGLKVIHLDSLYWRPGWVATPQDAWRELLGELLRGKTWIMDGNYTGSLNYRLPTADTVSFLDLPRHICIWLVIKRRFKYSGRSRPDMAPGCPERLSWEFLEWIWTYPTRRRPQVLELFERYSSDSNIIRLQSSKEVRTFLTEIRSGPNQANDRLHG